MIPMNKILQSASSLSYSTKKNHQPHHDEPRNKSHNVKIKKVPCLMFEQSFLYHVCNVSVFLLVQPKFPLVHGFQ